MKQQTLEIGKSYRNKLGETITIKYYSEQYTSKWPYYGVNSSGKEFNYDCNGKYLTKKEHPCDLIITNQ